MLQRNLMKQQKRKVDKDIKKQYNFENNFRIIFNLHLFLVHSPEVALGPKFFFEFFASK